MSNERGPRALARRTAPTPNPRAYRTTTQQEAQAQALAHKIATMNVFVAYLRSLPHPLARGFAICEAVWTHSQMGRRRVLARLEERREL